MSDETFHELRRVRHKLWELHRDLLENLLAAFLDNSKLERETAMGALQDLQALLPRLDAVINAWPTDISQAVATAVADQKATDDAANQANIDALATAQTVATQAETDLQATVTDLTAKVVAAEALAGITHTPPVTAAFSLSPTSVSATAGVASSTTVTVSGGVGPYSATGLPGGVTFDGSTVSFDDTTVAGTTTSAVVDSSSPQLTAPLDIVIS